MTKFIKHVSTHCQLELPIIFNNSPNNSDQPLLHWLTPKRQLRKRVHEGHVQQSRYSDQTLLPTMTLEEWDADQTEARREPTTAGSCITAIFWHIVITMAHLYWSHYTCNFIIIIEILQKPDHYYYKLTKNKELYQQQSSSCCNQLFFVSPIQNRLNKRNKNSF